MKQWIDPKNDADQFEEKKIRKGWKKTEKNLNQNKKNLSPSGEKWMQTTNN